MSISEGFVAPVSGVVLSPTPVGWDAGTSSREVLRFSVDDYHRLDELGMLPADVRMELLEGIVFMMSPIGPSHATCTDLLNRAFWKVLPNKWDVSAGRDIVLAASVPQPDISVLRGALRDFSARKPRAEDLCIVVEVSDSTLEFDRTAKQRIYAAAGIPEYWIVNLPERQVEVYRKPVAATGEQPAKYETVATFGPDQTIDVVLDGTPVGSILVKDILP
ncbi:MAG: Uma2 family endonuclease [Pirellula sp.]|nr:Uma2 family endonuclease [Pirellula sp.]